jgi:serine/threonine protein kinase
MTDVDHEHLVVHREAQTPERHAQVMEEFDAAADLDPAAQRAYLDGLRQRDADLAREVESLLGYDASSGPVFGLGRGPAVFPGIAGSTASSGEPGTAGEHASQTSSEQPDTGQVLARSVALDPGTVVAGRYRVGDVIGSGGGGTVCRAHDLEKGVDVAVKFLRPTRLQNERGLERFLREFRAVARLDHPGCLQAFTEGVEEGRRYIVMEYVSGRDLDRLVGGPTDVVLAVLVQVAWALDYVHSRRIVHRDLKPANVLLVPGDPPSPRLADFGIAMLEDESARPTEGGGLVGTVDYLSPEQVQGRPADPRSDLYALGCMIFRLWAGRPPFLGPVHARLAARCREAPQLLRSLAPAAPVGLEELTARLLAINPADRPQSALEVADVLFALLVATGSRLASRLPWKGRSDVDRMLRGVGRPSTDSR